MTEPTFACNLFALSAEERQHHAGLLAQLAQAVAEVQELPDGYAFQYRAAESLWSTITEWIALEHRCCPFLTFTLRLAPDEALQLQLTGPDGVKPFLAEELHQFVRSQ